MLPVLLWAPPAWRAAPASPVHAVRAVLPVAGPPVVLRGFEPPPVGQPWLSGHRGVDLAAAAWSSVRSAAPGVVAFAGPVAGRGVVVVRAGPLRWTYEPVTPSVPPGRPVRAGDPLGRLEPLLAHCDRPCLHWGLLRGDTYLDPLAAIGAGASAVRLLPLVGDPGSAGDQLVPTAPRVPASRAGGPGADPERPIGLAVAAGAGGGVAVGAAALTVVSRRRTRAR